MSCLCVGCNPAKLGCGTPDCDCTPCVRPNSAVLDFEFGWDTTKNHCVYRQYTTSCPPMYANGFYAIQNCDIASRLERFNNTYILDKLNCLEQNNISSSNGTTWPQDCAVWECDDFNYGCYSTLDTLTGQVCNVGGFEITFAVLISLTPGFLIFRFHSLPLLLRLSCGCFPCACGGTFSLELRYIRNILIPCNSTSVTYKTRTKDSCLIYPREITVELVDI